MADKEKLAEPSATRDFFTDLMFGKHYFPEETNTQSSSSENPVNRTEEKMAVQSEPDQHSEEENAFPLLPLLFQEKRGDRDDPFEFVLPAAQRRMTASHEKLDYLKHILENINYMELIENIDHLLKAAQKFKPVLKNIRSVLNSLQKR